MTRRLLIKTILLLAVCAVLEGCASMFTGGARNVPLTPKATLKAANKAYLGRSYDQALVYYERVLKTKPKLVKNKRRVKHLDNYYDTQVQYGIRQARNAEEAARPEDAFVFYTRVAGIYPSREVCQEAAADAARVRAKIAQQYLSEAQQLLAYDKPGAAKKACQSLWFGGGDPAQQVLIQATGSPEAADAFAWQAATIRSSDIQGPIRTDTLARLVKTPEFAPYGTPIFFGDAPLYYISMGKLTVKGFPRIDPDTVMPPGTVDALALLSVQAKKLGADAIANVHMWTKRKRMRVTAELVRKADLPVNDAGFMQVQAHFVPGSASAAAGQ